jgi:predicted DNA-binding transcriptional regulator YafY
VHPLGLAAKGAVWYLVAGTDAGLRTFRVDRMVAVASTGQRVVRPEGFDLAEAWRLISTEVEERRAPFRATVLATPPAVAQCRWVLGTRVRIGPPSTDGRIELEIRGHSFRSLAGELAGFGPELEIVDPPEVREHLARIGSELTASYGTVAGSQTRAKWARSTRPERSRVAVSSAVGEVRSDAKVVRPTA